MDAIYRVNDLTYAYPGSDRRVLDGASLTLGRGEVLSILGPNGAGKSTLLNCMAGLLRPTAGKIELCGKPIASMRQREIARQVAYVQQNHIPSFSYSVFEFVLMGRAPKVGFFGRPGEKDREAVWRVLSELGIAQLANQPYTEISGGERQQCTIARAMVQEPQAILFDEPTAYLDFGNQARILKVIRRMAEEGYSVVMTTHNPDHVILLGGRAAIVDHQGQITCGSVEEVVTESRLREVYETDLKIIQVEELHRKACLHEGLDDS
jgi:iron complex transport system ATP-binding protein